jgi:hypothetical protein
MKEFIPAFVVASAVMMGPQATGHPFDSRKIIAAADSFVVVTRVTEGRWAPVGGIVQTVVRDTNAIRLSVDAVFADSKHRVELAMHPQTLAPLAHWEKISRQGRGDANGEVMFSDGRARGAFILSRRVFDVPLDSGVVDDDASTALLASLPLDSARAFTFRTFASPGETQITRVEVGGVDTVSVPAGRFPAHRLVVMARDTSIVFVSTSLPRRVVLVRLGAGSQEMRLINRR